MKPILILLTASLVLAGCAAPANKTTVKQNDKPAVAAAGDDPYLWLEDVDGAKAMDWVKARDAESVKAYGTSPAFEEMRTQILEVMDSDARIPYVGKMGEHYYNFWKDKTHPRGIWRRTTLAEYRKEHPSWETIIDVDALGKAEGVNWVWHGADCLKPEYRHCLISLSRGGADASVVREFDLGAKAFVKDGFFLPEAKSQVDWIDENTIYVGTDFGPGSLTTSGYPRIAKLWKRGTPLTTALPS